MPFGERAASRKSSPRFLRRIPRTGIEDQRVLGRRFERLDRGGWGDRVRQQDRALGGQAGGEEELAVVGVEEGLADPRGVRVEGLGVGDDRVVLRAAVFGEVVELQDHRVARLGEDRDGIGDGPVAAERVVVEVPDDRAGAEHAGGGGAHRLGKLRARWGRRDRCRSGGLRRLAPADFGSRFVRLAAQDDVGDSAEF